MTLQWNAETLWEQLEPLLPGLSIEVVPTLASTNTTLLERARGLTRRGTDPAAETDASDEPAVQVRRSRESAAFGRRSVDVLPCLLVAEHQTGGRGRMGRTWTAAPGVSLTCSLAVPITRSDWSGLSLAVGLALADALEPDPSGTPRVALKWPNDLWLRDAPAPAGRPGRKLGGILIESVAAGASRLAVIGIGLNVLPQPADLPADLAHGWASAGELMAAARAPDVLHRIARPLIAAVTAFERHGFTAEQVERYGRRDLLQGHAVTTTAPDVPHGTACGISSAGALRVRRPDGTVCDVSSGEVSVRLAGADPDHPADGAAS